MKRRMQAPIIWTAIVFVLLAGAYGIVARFGPREGGTSTATYMH